MAENEQEQSVNTPAQKVDKEIVERKVKGVVKWFNVKSGYGFVQRSDNNEDLFIHQSEIAVNNPSKSRKSVGENENIEFDVANGAKGLEAVNVTGPDGAPVQGSRYARSFRGRRPYRNFSQSSDRGMGRRGGPRGGPMGGYRGRGGYNGPPNFYRPQYYDAPEYMAGPYPPPPPPGRMLYYGRPPPRRAMYRQPGPGGYYFKPMGDEFGPPINGQFRGRYPRGGRRNDYYPREHGDSTNEGQIQPEGRRRGQQRRKRRSMGKSETEGTDQEHGVNEVTANMDKMAVKDKPVPNAAAATKA